MAVLFSRLTEVLPPYCLMVWNTTLPISKNARGGFLVQEIEYKNYMLRMDVLEANYYARQVVVSHGFDVLDLHFWFRQRLDWRAQDGIHWWVLMVCRPVYPYGFAVIPTDSDLKFRCYAGWVKNYGHCPIFPFPHFKHRHRIETVKGPKPSHDRKLLPLEYRLRMLIVKTLFLPPSLKWALGRWVKLKAMLKIRDWLPPQN